MFRRVCYRNIVFSAACSLAASPAILFAQTSTPPKPVATPNLSPPPLHAGIADTIALPPALPLLRPFSAIVIQIKAGFAGSGIDLATPLAQHLNLRGGGSFINYNAGYSVDGMSLEGQINFRTANVSLDWYPTRGGFRISPGVILYNGNNLNGKLSVPGGQNFSLGDGTYTSSPSNPVHGMGSITFGKRTVPSFTVGWGNMIPRNGRRFSIPFEVGFQYIDLPKINFNLAGTACNNMGCSNIATDPTTQANLQQEITTIDNEIAPLRFYPIISIGFAWAFGLHSTQTY